MHCLQYYCTRNHVQTWISIICSCTIVQYYCKLCYYLFTSLFLCLSFWSSLLIEFYKTTYNITIFFNLSFKIELLDTTLFWAAFVVIYFQCHFGPVHVKLNKKNKWTWFESQQGIIFIFHIFRVDFTIANHVREKISQQEKTFYTYKMCFLVQLFCSCWHIFSLTWFAIVKSTRKIWKIKIIPCWLSILVQFYMNWPNS